MNKNTENTISNIRNMEWKADHDYRSYWDLYAAILKVFLRYPRTITFILQETNQKYVSVRKQLHFLLKKGLLDEQKIKSGICYLTSSSGIVYLEKYLDLWNHVFKNKK